jgi:bacillithiol biosynthesis deacetylase BshB1
MKLDILAFGAHPDDVELGAGGTLAKHAKQGAKTGIIDLTRGEMGTRGTPEIRDDEAKIAAKILGCAVRENLKMRDGFLVNDEASQLQIVKIIRKYQPEIILINAPRDRHPDHGVASEMVLQASFKSGFAKLETELDGQKQNAWRPKVIYKYIQFYDLKPDFIVDISGFHDKKMESVLAHSSQFYNPNSTEPDTVIASKSFFESLEARSREYGRGIYVEHGEGFLVDRIIGAENLFSIK